MSVLLHLLNKKDYYSLSLTKITESNHLPVNSIRINFRLHFQFQVEDRLLRRMLKEAGVSKIQKVKWKYVGKLVRTKALRDTIVLPYEFDEGIRFLSL